MNLPTRIRTKREALELVAQVVPEYKRLLAEMRAGERTKIYPHTFLESELTDRLQTVLEWLRDPKVKIYKRPRWHLLYGLAVGVVRLASQNSRDWMYELDRQIADERWERNAAAKAAAETATGDGAMI